MTVAGAVNLWFVMVIALLLGIVTAIDNYFSHQVARLEAGRSGHLVQAPLSGQVAASHLELDREVRVEGRPPLLVDRGLVAGAMPLLLGDVGSHWCQQLEHRFDQRVPHGVVDAAGILTLHTHKTITDAAHPEHANDGSHNHHDVMCYDDGGPNYVSRRLTTCATEPAWWVDCNKDDYWKPSGGTHIADIQGALTVFNTAKSIWLSSLCSEATTPSRRGR